jgi:hypothetical protein
MQRGVLCSNTSPRAGDGEQYAGKGVAGIYLAAMIALIVIAFSRGVAAMTRLKAMDLSASAKPLVRAAVQVALAP